MIKGSETQKQRLHELLWMLWFDEKSISNVLILLSRLGEHISRLCNHYWVSVPIRANFFYQCLQNFNIAKFVKKGQYAIRSLRDISHELRDLEQSNAEKKIGAGASLIGGGVVSGLGISKLMLLITMPKWDVSNDKLRRIGNVIPFLEFFFANVET